jgi:glycosyltransferase involved in cell wall biosynthesis
MKFTLVSTVFNEAKRLKESLNDLSKQSLFPEACIIIDAGSTDNTVEILNTWGTEVPFEVIVQVVPGANVAKGRNKAIELAKTELIVSTDFGCRYHVDFLKSLVTPFIDKKVEVVGGGYSVIEKDIQTIWSKANYIIANGYECHPQPGFIPSSRSIAYYKHIWERAGRYPEWLTLAADDLVFGLVLQNQNVTMAFASDANVYWGRHATFKAYGKEAYRYGLGDGEAEVNRREILMKTIETTVRYASLLVLLGLLIGFIWRGVSPYNFLFLVPFLLGYKSYLRVLKYWWRWKSEKYNLTVMLACLPLIELTRFNYIKGYIKGYFLKSSEQKRMAEYWKKNYLSS